MKYSYDWLKELSKTKLSPEKVAENITAHSFEVDNWKMVENKLDKVVVGKILEIGKHPNADRLQIVKVDVGRAISPSLLTSLPEGESKSMNGLLIVCGAHNIAVGDKVPVALVGAKLPGGEIKEMEVRGVKSFGMLCAEDELGIGDDHSGIMILDPGAKIGAKVLDFEDAVMDIKVLPDRAHDALSHIGMAREVAAIEGRNPEPRGVQGAMRALQRFAKSEKLKLEIRDKHLCPRYVGAVLENVEIKPSPLWLKQRLLVCGVRPINNIVDATNYVMLETGQPLHAFDYKEIGGAKIVVRRAKNGEEIKLLDETIKKLTEDDLVIADERRALAIAGVMGGEDSGISEATKTIVLESANFDAASIRKTRMRHGLKTEASDRFEKDIDPNLAEKTMVRIIELVKELAGGQLEGVVDSYPKKIKAWKIKLDLERVDNLLGEKISKVKVVNILESLGIQVGKNLECTIPTRRLDLRSQENLMEEIGRIYGYEKIRSQAPHIKLAPPVANEKRMFERRVKEILAGIGFDEVYNYSFYSARDAELAQVGAIRHLELQNPMNPDQALMRVSLLPNLLKNVRENLKNFGDIHIFEIGKIYLSDGKALPEEKRMLAGAIVLEGNSKQPAASFFEAKGMLDVLLQRLRLDDYYFDSFDVSAQNTLSTLWHSGRTAELKSEEGNVEFGIAGEINPLVLSDFDIHKRVVMFEIDLDKLQKISEAEREFQPISKFPVVSRDISMLAESDVRVDDILKNIQTAGGDLVLDTDLFDIFEKDDKNSFAFHIVFGASDRTLEHQEIDGLMQKIISSLEKELGLEVRK